MKLVAKIFLGLAWLAPTLALAQGPSSAQIEANKGKLKSYTTAQLPTICAPGTLVYDSTLQKTKQCQNDAATWALVGGTISGSGTTSYMAYWSSSTALAASNLYLGTAETFAFSHGGASQEIHLYKSVDNVASPTNYSRLRTYNDGANWFVTTQGGGTGAATGLKLGTVGQATYIAGNSHADDLLVADRIYAQVSMDGWALGTINNGASLAWKNFGVMTSIQGSRVKNLTAGANTDFVAIAVEQEDRPLAYPRVAGEILYSLEADDDVDFQVRYGRLSFVAVNKAGTITCVLGAVSEIVAASAGTLTNSGFTCTTTASTIAIGVNAASSLTETTLAIRYRVEAVAGSNSPDGTNGANYGWGSIITPQ